MRARVLGSFVAIGLGLGLLAPARGLADDTPPDRTELMSGIDTKTRAIRDDLDGVTMAADAHGIDSALAAASEVHELLVQLETVKADNARANDVAAHYPAYVDAFRAAATQLETLKQDQVLADGIADQCTADEAQVAALIAKSKTDEPERRAAKLSGKGKDVGRRWSDALAKLKATDAEVTTAAAGAHMKLTDSYWLDISNRVNDAGKGMAAYWVDSYQAAVGACSNLALGERHPDLGPILDELAAAQHAEKSEINQLLADYNIWLDDLRALREQATTGRESIRDTICKATGGELEEHTKDVADQLARELDKRHEHALATADTLRTRTANAALKKSRTARAIADGVRVNLPILLKLKGSELTGRANPKLHAKLAAITARHDATRASQGCAYKDVALAVGDCAIASRPGAACHLDCIKIAKKTCDFIEVVPQNDHAKSEGFAHGDVYAQGLHNWYVRDKKQLLAQYPAVHGCENSNQTDLDMTNEVITVDVCAKLTAADFGDALPPVSADLANTD